jgi:hypothetical protein
MAGRRSSHNCYLKTIDLIPSSHVIWYFWLQDGPYKFVAKFYLIYVEDPLLDHAVLQCRRARLPFRHDVLYYNHFTSTENHAYSL